MPATPSNIAPEHLSELAANVRSFFEKQGINASQALVTEALSTSISAVGLRVQAGLKANEPRWLVHATYDVDGGYFAKAFRGDSWMQGSIACQLNRMANDCPVTVGSVVDKLTGDTITDSDEASALDQNQSTNFKSFLRTAKVLASKDDSLSEDVAFALVGLDASLDRRAADGMDEMGAVGARSRVDPQKVLLTGFGLEREFDPIEAMIALGTYVVDRSSEGDLEAKRYGYYAIEAAARFDVDLHNALVLEDEIDLGDLFAGKPSQTTWAAIAREQKDLFHAKEVAHSPPIFRRS